jgi:hypothetical protein
MENTLVADSKKGEKRQKGKLNVQTLYKLELSSRDGCARLPSQLESRCSSQPSIHFSLEPSPPIRFPIGLSEGEIRSLESQP